MTTLDILQETYGALSANKVRSGLTMLGIVIGISSVIAMISIGQGAQRTIQANIQSIGSNLITISPGVQRGIGTQVSSGQGSARSLTQSDANAIIKEISLAKAVSPELSGRYQIVSKGKNTNTTVLGSTPSYPLVRNVEIDEGNFITEQNIKAGSKVAVLGPTARDSLFGEGVSAIGQTIRIKNIEFKVIGITKVKGGSGFSNQDDIVFIPLSAAQRYLVGDQYVTSISIQAVNAESMTELHYFVTQS